MAGLVELSVPELSFLSAYAELDPHKQKAEVLGAYRAAFSIEADTPSDKAVATRVGRLLADRQARVYLRSMKDQAREQIRRTSAERIEWRANLLQRIDDKLLEKADEWLDDADDEKAIGKAQLMKAVRELRDSAARETPDSAEDAQARESRMAHLEARLAPTPEVPMGVEGKA